MQILKRIICPLVVGWLHCTQHVFKASVLRSVLVLNNYLIIETQSEMSGMAAEQEHSSALSVFRLCRDVIATYWLVFLHNGRKR